MSPRLSEVMYLTLESLHTLAGRIHPAHLIHDAAHTGTCGLAQDTLTVCHPSILSITFSAQRFRQATRAQRGHTWSSSGGARAEKREAWTTSQIVRPE